MFTALKDSLAAPMARRAPRGAVGRSMRRVEPPSAPDRTPLEDPPCGRGHIDRMDDGFMSGWASGPEGKPIDAPVTVWVDGRPVTSFERVAYRADLEAAGIAEGRAAFEVDVGEAIARGAGDIDVALSFGDEDAPRFFLRQRVALPNHAALNPAPYPRRVGPDEVEGWSIDCAADLVLDDFPLDGPPLDHAERYVRFALVDHAHAADPVGDAATLRLRTPLATPPSGGADLTLGLLLRADRPVGITCRLLIDGEVRGELATSANSVWRLERHELPGGADPKVAPGARWELELTVPHKGRGFLDLALCCVSENVSFRYLRRTHAAPLAIERRAPQSSAVRSYLDNGRFERWSQGTDFSDLSSGDPLADNWHFEGRGDQLANVSVAAQSVPHTAQGRPPGFGLRVRTARFEGAMRLVGELDPGLLDEPALVVRAALHAADTTGFALVRRILLLGRGAGREVILGVISRGVHVRGTCSVGVRLDETTMVRLRRGFADLSSVLLAVEFEQNADVLVEALYVESAPVIATGEPTPPRPAAAGGFEDPAIVAQLPHIEGLESWLTDETCTDAALVSPTGAPRAAAGAGTGELVGLEGLRAASMRRPRPGYPTVDIIVPIHNALESVRECVRSVLERTTVPYTLTLVDDGSDAETGAWLAAVAARFPNVALLVNPANLGYTKTVNNGLRHCDADYVCVLNSDCVVTTGWLERLVDCAVDTGAGMVGPLSNAASYQSVPRIRQDGQWCFNPLPGSMSPEAVAALVAEHSEGARPSVRIINGFCQLVSRRAVDTVGLLDEDAFPRGFGEENDFCARVVGAGLGIRVADDAYVFHAKSQSFGHAQRKELSRQGSQALKDKHPGIDWNEITAELENQPAIARLRERLMENGL